MTRNHAHATRRSRVERLRLSALLAAGGAALAAVSLGASGCGDRRADQGASTTTVVSNAEPGATTVTTTTDPAPSPSPSVPASTESVNAGPGDATGTQARVADEVNTRIIRNPQMTGSRINVVVDAAGVATLTGFTQNQQQKALAERAAEKTPGVVSVENKLEIRPTGGTGKAPKPAPTPAAPRTQVIVVPGPAPAAPSPAPRQEPAPAPDPVASPLQGFEEGGTIPSPAPTPASVEGGTGL